MQKRNVVILLLALIFSLSFTTIHGATSNYSDTKTGDWFYEALEATSAQNIISGYPDGTFRPNALLTADQLIKMLCVVNNFDLTNAPTYWAQNYIDKGLELNWYDQTNITNYSDPLTRFDAMQLILNAAPTIDLIDNASDYKLFISDYNDIPLLYRDAVLALYANGISNGYPDASIQGTNSLTRAEASTLIHRVIDSSVRLQSKDVESAIAIDTIINSGLIIQHSDMSELFNYEYGQYKFFNTDTDKWFLLSETNLTAPSKLILEQTLNHMIKTLSPLDGYELFTAYENHKFMLTIFNSNQAIIMQLSINDYSDVMEIQLGNMANGGTLITSRNKALLENLLTYIVDDASLATNTIVTNFYSLSNQADPKISTINSNKLTMYREYEYFYISID